MNLLKTERRTSEVRNGPKLCALLFLAVACALFGASLLTPQSAQVGMEGRLTTGGIIRH